MKRKQAEDILLQKNQVSVECESRDSVSEFQHLSESVILIQDIKRSILSLQQYEDIVKNY